MFSSSHFLSHGWIEVVHYRTLKGRGDRGNRAAKNIVLAMFKLVNINSGTGIQKLLKFLRNKEILGFYTITLGLIMSSWAGTAGGIS